MIEKITNEQIFIKYPTSEEDHPFYTKKGYGNGISSCILGNTDYTGEPNWYGMTLPNCVGLASGLFNELIYVNNKLSEPKESYPFNMDADSFCSVAVKNYKLPIMVRTTSTEFDSSDYDQSLIIRSDDIPPIGSMLVWRRTSGSQNQHVAVVTKIVDDNTVLTVESSWSGDTVLDDTEDGSIYIPRYRDRGWSRYNTDYTSRYIGCVLNPSMKVKYPECNIGNIKANPKIYDGTNWVNATPCIRYETGWYKFYNTGIEKVEDI